MSDILEQIKKTQQEAKNIINDALVEAEKITDNLIQKSMTLHDITYNSEINNAKGKANKMLADAKKSLNKDLEKITQDAETKANAIEEKAKSKKQIAVEEVFKIILHRNEKT